MSQIKRWSGFIQPGLSVWSGDVSSPKAAAAIPLALPEDTDRVDVLSYRSETFDLALGDTRSIQTPLFGAAEMFSVVLRVVGRVEVHTTGTDHLGAACQGHVVCYGTALFPGFLALGTMKNLTAAEIVALAASTVELIASIPVLSTDARLL